MRWVLLVFFFVSTNNLFAQQWLPFGHGITGQVNWESHVYALLDDTVNHSLYAGGHFDSAGGIYTPNLAVWDGQNWHSTMTSLGGSPDDIYAITMLNDSLVLAGGEGSFLYLYKDSDLYDYFPSPGNLTRVFQWYDGELYAGGNYGIKKFNGNNWIPVGGNVGGTSPDVHSMSFYNGSLIVGGSFEVAGTIQVNNIASWNGFQWDSLEGGVTGSLIGGHVLALTVFNDNLYAGGIFDKAGEVTVQNLAKWDGLDWLALGDANNDVLAMQGINNFLIVGGVITDVDGLSVGTNAAWDGTNWSDMNQGFTGGSLDALTIYNNNLVAGGRFILAKDDSALLNHVAYYDFSTGIKNHIESNELFVWPNLTTSQLTISFLSCNLPSSLFILNTLGQLLREEKPGSATETIDVSSLASGLYFLEVKTQDGIAVKKFVKQ